MSDEALDVALDLDGTTVAVGVARVHRRRGRTTTSFSYESSYLVRPGTYPVDPALQLDTRGGVVDGLPGAFADSTPDRWGRRLVTRRMRTERQEGQTMPEVSDVGFLLGVSDITRQGALRFRRQGQTEWADPRPDVPKAIRLPELLRAADRVARDDGDDSDLAAVKLLLDAGSGSLGGARPKASILGDDGRLYIAKFPHPGDEWDVMAWEKTALDLAERAGIEVPHRLATRVDGQRVLLVERFDRFGDRRVGYMSAMTLVQGRDGDGHDYLDLAAEVAGAAEEAEDDLAALWRRVAFSVAIHNTDDHLRNHGFLRGRAGWRLSPIFDVNPNPEPERERVTGIGGATSRSDELDGLLVNAIEFGLSRSDAAQVLAEVSEATLGWREVASANGVPTSELRHFEEAFEGQRDSMAAATRAPGSPTPRRRGGPRRTVTRGRTTPAIDTGSFAPSRLAGSEAELD